METQKTKSVPEQGTPKAQPAGKAGAKNPGDTQLFHDHRDAADAFRDERSPVAREAEEADLAEPGESLPGKQPPGWTTRNV